MRVAALFFGRLAAGAFDAAAAAGLRDAARPTRSGTVAHLSGERVRSRLAGRVDLASARHDTQFTP
jgi:hypothetical protein